MINFDLVWFILLTMAKVFVPAGIVLWLVVWGMEKRTNRRKKWKIGR